MLLSLPSGFHETLEKMGFVTALYDSGFQMALGRLMYCCSRDVDWLQCASSWFPHAFTIGEVFDVMSSSASSTCRCCADCKPIIDPILPAWPVLFVSEDLTLLPTIRERVRQLLSEYHLSEVPGSDSTSGVPEAGEFHAYAFDVEGEGD